MRILTIDTGFFKLDGGAMFGTIPKSIWHTLQPADEKNLCTWAMRCLLIEDGERLILIDCGLGKKQSEKFFSYYSPHGDANLLHSLHLAGYSEREVTDVILTHLHFDHCGGAVVRTNENKLEPQFQNAIYWSHHKHWDWATIDPNPREKPSFLTENFLPLAESGQLKFIDTETQEFDNINFFLSYGHTESQLIPVIDYNGRTIVYCGDLIPSLHHIPVNYVMGYDIRPLITMKERAEFLSGLVSQDAILVFEHDPKNEACTLQQTEKGVRAAITGTFQDLIGR